LLVLVVLAVGGAAQAGGPNLRRLPARSRGKRFSGRVAATVEGKTVARAFRRVVR
jgi:hypothetical protein